MSETSGATSGGVINNGDTIFIESGEIWISTIIDPGGDLEIVNGGVAIDSIVRGFEYADGGGGTTISSLVLAGGVEDARSGGTSISAVISGASMIENNADGNFPDESYSAGGGLLVEAGGLALGAVVSGDGSNVLGAIIYTGGTMSGGSVIDTQLHVDSRATINNVFAADDTFVVNWGSSFGGTLMSASKEEIESGAITSNLLVESGGTLLVSAAGSHLLSAGTASGNVIGTGGTEIVGQQGGFFGGLSVNDTISGGTLLLEAFGVASHTTVESGGYVLDEYGAVASGAIISAGGTMVVTSLTFAGTASAATVSSGGTLLASAGGILTSTSVDAGGTEVISAGGIASNTIVDGGTVILSSGGSIIGTTQVLSGGTLVISGSGGGAGGIQLGSIAEGKTGGATLVVTTSNTFNVVSSVVSGDDIRFANLAYNGGELAGSGSTTIDGIQIVETASSLVVTENGVSDTIKVDNIETYGWNFKDVDGQLDFEICFAEGTLIATPDGEQKVEALRVGDMVQTLAGDRPIKWMGHRSVDLTRLRDPEAHRLIRVQKGAFADNVPHTDLLITPEHSIYVDGVFVPVRLLVNGATIARDTLIDRYTYFHVELDSHGILIANGLTTESYLDTGNRHQFANSGVTSMGIAFSENETHASWADAAAPLVVDPATTQPIWDRLAERAKDRGFVLEQVETDLEPDLHLVINDRVIRPAKALGIGIEHRYVFNLPLSLREQEGAFAARLVSKATASADVQPWIDDRRELGVMVESIVLFQHDGAPLVIDMQDDATLADGWWTWESIMGQPVRWTNGDATLPVTANTRSVEVILTAVTRYLAKPARKSKRRAA